MSLLNDHPVVTPAEIRAATAGELPSSDLHGQTEQLRITPLNLGADTMFEIWRVFRTSYRISVAYELAVVLLGADAPSGLGPLAQQILRSRRGTSSNPIGSRSTACARSPSGHALSGTRPCCGAERPARRLNAG